MKSAFASSLIMLSWLGSCTPTEPNELDKLGLATVKVRDLTVRAWIADETEELRRGLMFVTADEMAPLPGGVERGMLFLFSREQNTGFWMKNTIIDLDIAFIAADGRVVRIMTMAALDEEIYESRVTYRYALEVNAGVLAHHGVAEGDKVDIPNSVLKRKE